MHLLMLNMLSRGPWISIHYLWYQFDIISDWLDKGIDKFYDSKEKLF